VVRVNTRSAAKNAATVAVPNEGHVRPRRGDSSPTVVPIPSTSANGDQSIRAAAEPGEPIPAKASWEHDRSGSITGVHRSYGICVTY
jgi:hypothetical protein